MYPIEITKSGGTVWVRSGQAHIAIDGSDFSNDRAWRNGVLERVKELLQTLTLEEESDMERDRR